MTANFTSGTIHGSVRGSLPPVPNLLLLGASVALASLISVHLVTENGHIAVLWLANGITFATLLTSATRFWPAYLLTGFSANVAIGLLNTITPALTIALSFANVLEILVAASFVYRPDRPSQHFTDRVSAWRMLIGFLLGPAASTVVAVVARYAIVATPPEQTVQVWYLAHGIGLAITVPLTLTVLFKDFAPLLKRQALLRTGCSILVLVVATTLVFHQTQLPLLFFVFPPLALVVFQLGFPGMTIGLFVLATEMSFFTLAGSGPFTLMRDASQGQRILMAQVFLLTCVAMAVPIAIALTERSRLEQRLLAAQEQLRQLAATDQLTGISNRRMFDEFLDREWKRAVRDRTPLCAIMIDVDNFKSYNDRYGHLAGDECLKAVAAGLAEVVRRPGDLVARYGGEEFVILLPHTKLEGASFVAEQIRRRVEALQIVHSGTAHGRVTVSLGVETRTPAQGGSTDELIAAADSLLYAAKRQGRNCVMCNETEATPATRVFA